MRVLAGILLIVMAALPARAEEVLAGLSQTSVALTAGFEGAEILVFGAVRREAPIAADDPPLHVIVSIEGPQSAMTIWRAARRAGIWVNVDSVPVEAAPSFYAVATTAPLDQALTSVEDARHTISIPRVIGAISEAAAGDPAAAMEADDPATVPATPAQIATPQAVDFAEAMIRIRMREGLFQLLEGAVEIERDTLFSTRISLPANLTEGVYVTQIFLTRGGVVIDSVVTEIEVRKAGLERTLFQLAQDEPLLYGLLAVLLASLAGWLAAEGFRYFRS